MSDARTEILERITSIPRSPAGEAPRAYRQAGTLAAEERVALFCERVSEYRADVLRAASVAETVAERCAALGVRRLGIPAGLPAPWRPEGPELVADTGLTPHELDALDGVLTGCTVAVAETGTLALTAGPREGRRALTLVPDVHVCVVEEPRIVELVPEATALLGELVRRERRPITLVSGPSATSDIELDRMEGVHGPRTLVVVVTPEEVP